MTRIFIATVVSGKEECCCRDLRDALFPFDTGISARVLAKGLIEFTTRLEEDTVYKFLRWRRIRYLNRVIPVTFAVELKHLDLLKGKLRDLLELQKRCAEQSIALIIKKNDTSKENAKRVENVIRTVIAEAGFSLKSKKKSKLIVYVHVVCDTLVYVSVIPVEKYILTSLS